MLQYRRKKWFITGVAGFIGSHLLEHLLKKDQYVVGLDNFSTGFDHNIQDVLRTCSPAQQQNFEFYKGDIRDSAVCIKATAGADIILHQAALGSVPRSLSDPLTTHDVNVNGTLNMLEAARHNNVPVFVYASSSSVYGDSTILPKQEQTIGHLLSPYAVSKYTNELYADIYQRCYNVKTIGLRYFNVFGPRQNIEGPYSAVIPTWIMAFLKGEKIRIYGDGLTSRDFTFIDNIVDLNMRAVDTAVLCTHSQVYNGAAGAQTTLNDLLQLIKSEFKDKPECVIDYQNFRDGDILHSFADLSKTKTDLNYSPLYSLKQGIVATVQWFKQKYD